MIDPSYDPLLVGLSAVVSLAGSYVGLGLAKRIGSANDAASYRALAAAAGAIGAGAIWSMHFTAMLAFHLGPVEIAYELVPTLLSLALAIVFTGAGMWIIARRGSRPFALAMAGTIMGFGVAGMHFTGVAGMHVDANVRIDPVLVAVSVAIAIAASAAALFLAFDGRAARWRGAASLIMAAAVLGMHYTGMAAVSFVATHPSVHAPQTQELSPWLVGGVALALNAAILLAGLVRAVAVGRAKRKLEGLVAEDERLRLTLDSVPQMIWSMQSDGSDEYYNAQWEEFTGVRLGSEGAVRRIELVHPDDRQRALSEWAACVASGTAYEAEYRMLHKSGEYRWVLSRGRPHADASGTIVRWYGTCADVQERLMAREALRESEARARSILDSVPQVIWTADPDGRIQFLSDQWKRFNGTSEEARLGDEWLDSVHPEDRERAWSQWRTSLQTGTPFEAEFRLWNRKGHYLWTLVRALPKFGEDGTVERWFGASTDIDARVGAQEALKASESLSRGIIAASPDCVSLLDLEGNVVFVNEATVRAYGADDSSHLVGRRWGSRFTEIYREKAEQALTGARRGELGHLLLPPANKAGDRWWDVAVAPVLDASGNPMNIVVISRDVTHQKKAEESARWAANHDVLTGLPNRFLLQQRLDEAIAAASAAASHFGLLLLDVDHFKRINDTLGHDAGDALLQTFAMRLANAARPDDTVARLGGDEFAVLLTGVGSEQELREAVERVLAALREPCIHAGRMLDCQASIGASIYPQQGTTRADLMKNADVALYAAKTAARGSFKMFKPEMRAEAQKRSSMLSVAKEALSQDWIVPYYQPKIDLRTGALAGFEALLRWRHPSRGIQPPSTLAAAFEDLTLAAQISDRMIDRAIGDMKRWLEEGTPFGHVAVNAAAAEFRQGDFAERLLERLHEASIPTRHVQVEVTETVFLGRGADYVERALKTLSANGVRIALDDFGTGFASLSHLKQFPVDILKIDRSFVRDLQIDPDDGAIIDAVINLGRSLNIEVVAEGIETMAQHDTIAALGCHYGQGYLYSKAMAAVRVPGLARRLAALERGASAERWMGPVLRAA